MSADLLEQFSKKLAEVAEERDQIKFELSYTRDQLTLSQAQNSALKGQVELFEQAARLRQSVTQNLATNPTSMFGSTKPKVAAKESGSALDPSSITPAA